jgi:hypothetical protein
MSCRVETQVEHHADAVHVPVQCVTRVDGRPTVYVVEGGKVAPRAVEIGLDNGQFIHVVAGLNGGETVLLAPPLGQAGEDESRRPAEPEKDGGGGERLRSNPEPPAPRGSGKSASDGAAPRDESRGLAAGRPDVNSRVN